MLVEKVPSPTQPLNSSTEYRGAVYGPCVNRQDVDATVVPHLNNETNSLTCIISILIEGVQEERGRVR